MAAPIDLFKLIWPVTGGYRLLLPALADRAWLPMRRLARWYRRTIIPRTCVVAVVGSLGKSTTQRMVAAALDDRRPPQVGNFGVRLAAGLLRVRPWHSHAVLEVGIAGPGWMSQFAKMLAPDIVVVTTISSSHNRSFKTLEETRAEKVKMVRALAPDGLAVLNGDDPNVRWMATQTRARVLTYGVGSENDVRATEVRMDWPSGMSLTMQVNGAVCQVRTRLIGAHMAYPVLAAVAVAHARGTPLEQATVRLEPVAPAPGRMEPVPLADGVTILSDEHKAGWEEILAALDVLATLPAARRVAVLGDIHEPQGSVHSLYRELGARVARSADRALLVGSHAQRGVITGAERAGMPRTALTFIGSSIHDVIALLRQELRSGDVVLIKGATTQRLNRIVLALQGRTVRCPVKVCKVRAIISCGKCPMLERDRSAFENVYLRRMTRV